MSEYRGHFSLYSFEEAAIMKNSIIQWASKHLAGGVEVIPDGLNCFFGPDDEEITHETIITGGEPDCAGLVKFCCRFNRRFDLRQMVSRFAYVAPRTPPTPQRLLKVAELCE